MGQAQANPKPFLVVATRHWAVAQRGQSQKPQRWGPDLAAPSAGILGPSRRGCAPLCTHRTPSEVPRTIGGTQGVPRGEQWQGIPLQSGCATGHVNCRVKAKSTSWKQVQVRVFYNGFNLFLKGMLRKTALHQMSSNLSCREFIKRREIYEQEESAGSHLQHWGCQSIL